MSAERIPSVPESDTEAVNRALAPSEGKPNQEEMRAKILALEAKLLALPQGEFKVTHHFSPGVYMREVLIPKGSLVTGKIHKTGHLNILSQGKLIVWTEDGMKWLTASTVIESKPGIKRVGYALEDSVWITVHQNPDNGQDVQKIEEMLIAKTFEEVTGSSEPKQIQGEESCHS